MVCLAMLGFTALSGGPAAHAQTGAGVSESEEAQGPALAIEIMEDGIGYTETGELLIQAVLSNVGTSAVPPLDVTVILLNDCVLTAVPQTCRFAAFGSFDDVLSNGLAAGGSVVWTFNFGVYPQLDLSRWSVIWYTAPAR